MTVGKAIFYLLDNSTDLTAIVGTRIYPEVAQQDAPLPYVVYNISNNEPSDTKREPSKLDTANIEVNCYSTSYTEVIDMAVAVRAALDRVRGTYNGVNVQSIAYMNEVIDFDEGQRAYNVSSDYDVRISRTDFEIAQGTPVTGVNLGDLADVNTTGVTDGQVIAYDAATSVWLPATDGGAQQLNDLSDVIIAQPASGEFFRYNGDEWTNDTAAKGDVGLGNVDNTSDANKPVSTAAQTALDLKADITSVPTELDDLNDVQIIGTPTLGQALVYGAGKWLPGAAGATELGDLDDVNTTGAGFGSLLTFNGSSWDISASELPTDNIYFHQRYETESEALRTGATATTELYFTCTADGNGLAESASSDTPTAGNVINRKIYYSEAGFADPDTGTWIEFTPAPADDATFATVKAALLENLKARTGGTVPISLKQTWEETTPSTYLLDQAYGSGAEAAYSTRQLRLAQTECMTIRRASDGTTTTIGFDGSGNIDEAAITTFCTGTDCTVSSWIDQSGNGNNATQATAADQPIIYTGGALVKESGKLALSIDDGFMDAASAISLTSDYFITSVFNTNTTQGFNMLLGSYNDTKSFLSLRTDEIKARNSASSINNFAGVAIGLSYNQRQLLTLSRASNSLQPSVDGNAHTAQTTSGTYNYDELFAYNSGLGSYRFGGNCQELILYAIDQLTNRTSIEENVGDYFTQNTPLLDTYSGAAAAYSLRLLDSTYTGSAIRVRRSSDNTEQDINFNIFGELDTVSLTAFAGVGDAFVKTWYDQSGSSNDATQTNTSAQPQIVSSGAVILENGKPALQFNGVGNTLQASVTSSDIISTNAENTLLSVMTQDSASAANGLVSMANPRYVTYTDFNGTLYYDAGNNSTNRLSVASPGGWDDTQHLLFWSSSLTLQQISVDGIQIASNTSQSTIASASATLIIGTYTQSFFQGNIQELVLFPLDKQTDRTGIETNVNTFYSIY